jgi:hypothetical protein
MEDTWEQTGAGMAEMVGKLPQVLRRMLGHSASLPRVVCTDRGPGFYLSGIRNGEIVPAYRAALRAGGFRPFAGDQAEWQPADCPDVLLHETAVGWIRQFCKKHPFSRSQSLESNVERVKTLMATCVQHINANHHVRDLCSSFPRRLGDVVEGEG